MHETSEVTLNDSEQTGLQFHDLNIQRQLDEIQARGGAPEELWCKA
jgi:hypothetical protein